MLDKFKVDKPVTGLPETRKRPHAFGAPSIAEFHAAIAKHRNPIRKPKAPKGSIASARTGRRS